jgi:hypothetical protein
MKTTMSDGVFFMTDGIIDLLRIPGFPTMTASKILIASVFAIEGRKLGLAEFPGKEVETAITTLP